MRVSTVILLIALAIVLAFSGSLIFGLRGRNTAPTTEPGEEKPQPAVVHDARAKVEVLNGSGKQGLAKLATEQLREAGFDVVQFGNARTVSATSSILDRVNRIDVARSVGNVLQITNVRTARDTTRYVDATVIIGKDWPLKKPY